MFENWIVNDGDENRENLEQSRYYDLITRDGKFVPETIWYKEWFSFDDGSDNDAFVTYNDEAFSLSDVLAYCPIHKSGIAEAVMQTLGLMADDKTVVDTLTDKQKSILYALIGETLRRRNGEDSGL